MDSVNKTLYIPLYGKAYVSRKGILLHDPKAEEIWAAESFPLKGRSRSKWLCYYMGIRAAVFDRWLKEKMEEDPTAAVLHIGCGMDSRCLRVPSHGRKWFDLDFPHVIRERQRYFRETEHYQMLGGDLKDPQWLGQLPCGNAIVIMEGVSMYLRPEELRQALAEISSHFEHVKVLIDCYTTFAAKASQYKNPVNDVGVTQVYGLDDPTILCSEDLSFVKEHEMTPQALINELQGMERQVFRSLYAGAVAKKMYRLYEYRSCRKST